MGLPEGVGRLRLRVVMYSDEAINMEGIAIDDVHIYDLDKKIYDSVILTSPVTQNLSGNTWNHFERDGKIIASIQPHNQNMGATAVQVYIDTAAIRNNNAQYYHGRNLTIKPANKQLTDSVSVRFYFTDKEMEKLLSANNCSGCSKPASAYELGVSKYSDPDDAFENGTVSDDQQGIWTFIASDKVAKVPFDKGYYAEFKVKDFSEFWLNGGGLDKSTPLPVKLLDFSAQKTVNDVLLRWEVGSETNVVRYEVELARTAQDLGANLFVKIGEVQGRGNSTSLQVYSFTDTETDKFGARYYRLKVIDADGSFRYSPVRTVVFTDAVTWQVYPNPSNGIFHFVYQVNAGEMLEAAVYDAKGSIIKTYKKTGTGYLQKLTIDLATEPFAVGMYLLQINAEGKKVSYKIYKQ